MIAAGTNYRIDGKFKFVDVAQTTEKSKKRTKSEK